MQITRLTEDGLKKSYKIIIPNSDIQKAISVELTKLGSRVKLPGFRPGKVPPAIVKQKYGAEVTHDILEKTISKAIAELVREHITDQKMKLAVAPSVQGIEFADDKDCELIVDLELLPKIEPSDFKKIKLEKFVVEVAESEIDDAIKKIYEEYKHYVPISENRPIKEGDVVHLDIVGKALINKKPTNDISQQLTVNLGEKESVFSGELEKQIIGKSVGDKITVDDVLPQDCENIDWRGAAVHFDAKVESIEELSKVEFGDSFAQVFKFDNLDAFKKTYSEKMQSQSEMVSFMLLKRKLLDSLSEMHTFDVPQSLLETEFNDIWARLQQELNSDPLSNSSDNDDNRTEEELRDEYRKISERRVRLGLLFSELAELYDIKLTDDEIKNEIYKVMYSNPSKAREIMTHFSRDRKAMDSLMAPVMENKVVEYILGQIDLKEVKVDQKTFEKEVAILFPKEESSN